MSDLFYSMLCFLLLVPSIKCLFQPTTKKLLNQSTIEWGTRRWECSRVRDSSKEEDDEKEEERAKASLPTVVKSTVHCHSSSS